MNVRRKIGALAGAAALTAGLGVAFVGSPAQANWTDCPAGAKANGSGADKNYNLCVWTTESAGNAAGVLPAELINDYAGGAVTPLSGVPAFYGDQANLTSTSTHPGWTNAVSAYNRRPTPSVLYYSVSNGGAGLNLPAGSAVADLTPTVWWHHVQSVDLQ